MQGRSRIGESPREGCGDTAGCGIDAWGHSPMCPKVRSWRAYPIAVYWRAVSLIAA